MRVVTKTVLLILCAAVMPSVLSAEGGAIVDAFPRSTLFYTEGRISEDYRTEMREAFDELKRLTGKTLDKHLADLPKKINEVVGTSLSQEDLEKIITGADETATGVTAVNVDAFEKDPSNAVDWLLVLNHRHADTLQSALDAAITKGSRFILGKAEHGAAKITNIEIPLPAQPGPDGMPPKEAGYRLQIAIRGNWVLIGNRQSTLLDGLDRLNGEMLEDSLAANANYKSALGGIQAESKGFINVAEILSLASKVEKANKAIDEYDLRSVRAIAFFGSMDYKARTSDFEIKVVFDSELKPAWFKKIAAARTSNVLIDLSEKSIAKLWIGANVSREDRDKLFNKVLENDKGTKPEDQEVFKQFLDLNPQEVAVYLLGLPKPAAPDKADSHTPDEEVAVPMPEGFIAMRFEKAMDAAFFDKIAKRMTNAERENDREPPIITEMKVVPEGYSGRKIGDAEFTIYFIWKDHLVFASTSDDFTTIVARANAAANRGKQDKLLEFSFAFKEYMKMIADFLPADNPASGSLEFFKDMNMSFLMAFRASDDSLAMSFRATNLPKTKDSMRFIAELIVGDQIEKSREKMGNIRELVLLGKLNSPDNEYPASLEELVKEGWAEASDLVDPLDDRVDSKNSFRYFQPAKDALRSGNNLLIVQQEVWLPSGKRLALLLSGEIRELDAAEYEAAIKLAKEGKPLADLPGAKRDMPLKEERKTYDTREERKYPDKTGGPYKTGAPSKTGEPTRD